MVNHFAKKTKDTLRLPLGHKIVLRGSRFFLFVLLLLLLETDGLLPSTMGINIVIVVV